MKRMLLCAFVLVCVIAAAPSFAAGGVTVKQGSGGEFKLYAEGSDYIGSLKKTGDDEYALQDEGGQIVGVISKQTGEMHFTHRHPTITPDVARLYLNAVDALKGMK